uniref:Protein kinase domain-containing protein n=1 Tax=Strigamia maritima TaxID=126957 RepID=T1IN09_STRMM
MILESSFQGYQHIYPNFTFGPRFNKMHPDKLEVFSTLKEVTGYINIQASHPNFQNLSYFRNLAVIGGRELTEYFSALYIVKTTLQSLELRSLESIRSGSVAILENKELCFAEEINWRKLMKNEQIILLQNNKPLNECRALNLICHPQCSKEGCWGVGPNECLSCANFKLSDTCIESCDISLGIYDSGNKICEQCHDECEQTCTGPGPANCSECKHVVDGPNCLAKCPALKYNGNGRCLPCGENCTEGCTGSGNFVGEGGCKSCERAIIRGRDKTMMTLECLNNTRTCPDGYFSDVVPPQETGILEPLRQKSVCRQCHRRCKKCTSYGFHLSACKECALFKYNEHCEDSCPSETYADNITRQCLPCSPECRGCSGPEPTQCDTCKSYKIIIGNNSSQFNCTTTCPPEMPHKHYPSEEDVPSCTNIEPESSTGKEKEETQYLPILLGVLGCIMLLGLFLALLGYQCWQRAKSKENTVKMTMRMTGYESDEPLKPSNVKPNLAKLHIVKEAELRRGGILGYGAFGTVYKGVWVPEGENVKIPVAIKVLREGTGSNANKEILEEAYIMASVEHPHLLQLLAVCMTSQMMLVTQLMPLGCLLDYVRNNKDKIGSKPLLNWCTQIAKGMSYLEERRLVHRDLAARNVLVQTPKCVKITDFGLAKLLDINEDEYKAAGGKMPIKWLALECIQHRIFTHKSDVWAFGVTVWELLTYGGRPYETVPAREVPDLLEKGERLPQPSVCTIDVYMIMIKCWMLDADSRPNFRELGDEFAKMARDPGRYLVIPGDKLMRLPSYTSQDEKELIRNLSVATEGPEIIMDAEEYLQPKITAPSPISDFSRYGLPLPLPSPIKPVVMDNQWLIDGIDGRSSNRSPQMRPRPDRKYSHLEAAAANSPNLHGRDLSNSRYSSDPLKLLNRDMDIDEMSNGLPVLF